MHEGWLPFARLVRGMRILGPRVAVQAAFYPLRKAYHTARFDESGRPRGRLAALLGTLPTLLRPQLPTPPEARDYVTLGDLQHHTVQGESVDFTCERGLLRLTFLAPDLVRVRLSATGAFAEPFSYAVARDDAGWPPCEMALSEGDLAIEIRTGRMVCRVEKQPCRLAFYDREGHLISRDDRGVGYAGNWVGCWRRLADDEHIYGLGEKATALDHRGRRYVMWNTDKQTYSPGDDPLYMSFPVYLGLNHGRGYGVFFDNTHCSIFDIGASDPGVLHFEAAGGEMRYYFFYGPELESVLERYTELTGRMYLPPLWALGYQHSRWSYYPELRVREIAEGFRARRIPCDAIHLDIHYMDGYRNFTWDRERFPDPPAMIAGLAKQGYKTVVLIDAGIKADPNDPTCANGLAQDVFLKYPDATLFSGPVWPGNSYFPDYTSPRVREWWGGLYRELLDMGVAGIWNDMNEPVVMGALGDWPPLAVRHDMEGHGGDHAAAHNVYGMQMVRATCEGLKRLRPARRPFIMTRSGYCGVQSYALGWTGDNESTWESMALTIPMVLNLGLSGLGFAGPDTGGFAGTASGELLTRWNQLSLFTPLFRNHTALLTGDQEPWAAGEPYTSINRRYIELRYRFLPSIYTATWQCSQRGRPMMRPLAMDWQEDERAAAIDDQFLFGDHLLVAPILQPFGTERRVYLPAGTWYDWWSDEVRAGPEEVVALAPLDVLPLYVRAGAVIPMGEVQQYVGEAEPGPVALHVYPGKAVSHLYEDAGDGWEHLHGQYRHTTFRVTPYEARLVLERLVEGEFDPGYERCEVIVHGLGVPPSGATADGVPLEMAYGGEPPVARVTVGAFRTLAISL